MPAIVTDTLKRQIARDFFDQFQNNTANYYVGVGRSEQWDSNELVPTPDNNPETQVDFRDGLQAIKKMIKFESFFRCECVAESQPSAHHQFNLTI